MSVRILGGVAKGREVAVPESARPSGARLRKSLFDLLAARADPDDFPTFLDLHGGSGAIGLEAASRGYDVTLVEKDSRAYKLLENNARSLGLRVKVMRGDSATMLERLGAFHIVFSDPPYEANIPQLTAQLLASGVVKMGGYLVAQHPSRRDQTPAEVVGYELERREYGNNTLSIYYREDDTREDTRTE